MLNDNEKGIFCIMTSNNVQDLPPELTRSGRLDAIFYFSLPSQEEREEILSIHYKKRGYNLNEHFLLALRFDSYLFQYEEADAFWVGGWGLSAQWNF